MRTLLVVILVAVLSARSLFAQTVGVDSATGVRLLQVARDVLRKPATASSATRQAAIADSLMLMGLLSPSTKDNPNYVGLARAALVQIAIAGQGLSATLPAAVSRLLRVALESPNDSVAVFAIIAMRSQEDGVARVDALTQLVLRPRTAVSALLALGTSYSSTPDTLAHAALRRLYAEGAVTDSTAQRWLTEFASRYVVARAHVLPRGAAAPPDAIARCRGLPLQFLQLPRDTNPHLAVASVFGRDASDNCRALALAVEAVRQRFKRLPEIVTWWRTGSPLEQGERRASAYQFAFQVGQRRPEVIVDVPSFKAHFLNVK